MQYVIIIIIVMNNLSVSFYNVVQLTVEYMAWRATAETIEYVRELMVDFVVQ